MMLAAALDPVLMQFLVILTVGYLLSLLARSAGAQGLVGGVLGGIVLGAAVLGQVSPQTHRWLILGGAEPQEQLEKLLEQRSSSRAALESTGVTEIALVEFDRETEAVAAPLRRAVAEAEARQAGGRDHVLAAAMVLLLAVAAGRAGPTFRLVMHELPTGLFAVVVSGGVAGAVVWGLASEGAPTDVAMWTWVMAAGLGAAALGLPWHADELDRAETRDRRLHGLFAVNLLITFIALAFLPLTHEGGHPPLALTSFSIDHPDFVQTMLLLGTCLLIAAAFPAYQRAVSAQGQSESHPATTLLTALIFFAMALGAVYRQIPMPLLAVLLGITFSHHRVMRALGALADDVVGPLFYALVGLRLELSGEFQWLGLLAALLVLGDGRAMGAALMFRYRGMTWLEAMERGARLIADGTVPLIVLTLLRMNQTISGDLYVLGVLSMVVLGLIAPPLLTAVARMGRGVG